MSDFKTVSAALTKPDPFKRVKYTMGLVLGVDEFEQEQTFFLERDRLQNRMLHGYGTVCGLELSADGTKVTVTPGLAVDPLGREIRVTPDQCADLSNWLAVQQNRDDVTKLHDGRPENLDLYVVLCYVECETDKVPVPGAPCRSQEESIAPSRITESFRLQFALTPPEQQEEEAIREFGDLLGRIRIVEDGATLTWDDLSGLVKSMAEPPESILINRADADGFIRGILGIWVTEVRPLKTGACGGPAESCLLLGKLSFALSASWEATGVTTDETDRPYLLTTRLLQEYLLRREDVTEHQYLIGLAADDHPQYLLVNNETRALIADLDAAGKKVVGLGQATANGEAVPFEQAIKQGDAAAGDLAATYPNPRVARIQGRPVANVAPAPGQVLTWNDAAKRWEPQAAPGGGGVSMEEIAKELPTLPFVTITRLPDDEAGSPRFELWFHLNASSDLNEANMPELVEMKPPEVFGEQDTVDPAPHFLRPIEVIDMEHTDRNVFVVKLDGNGHEFAYLRFIFVLEQMQFTIEGGSHRPLSDWLTERPVKWLGHDGRETVTAFHRNLLPQQAPASPYGPVTAGLVSNQGEVSASFNQLRAAAVGEGVYRLTFPGYRPTGRYVIKGTPVAARQEIPFPFTVMGQDRAGISVRVAANANSLPEGFMVEISEIR